MLLGSFAGGGYFYYTDTQNTIAVLRDNNAKLEIVAETNLATINQMKSDAEEAKMRMEQLSVRAREAEQYQDNLISKLRRHNLTALALQKPGMIETRVNNAISKLAKELEEYTSDKPVESDSTDDTSE
jgi:predicted DNA-binding ribbon-helix-helix protein